MKFFWSLIFVTSAFLFYMGIQANAHSIDIHLPTSYDYQLELEHNDRANREAEKTLNDPDSSYSEREKALEQLYGPNGNHA